ncbi:hypothetical protein [Merismopedia glauca]|nr:hypothetical protein [Merismopedia glauca]
MVSRFIVFPVLLALTALPASASDLVDSYTARLSRDDHFNTSGVRLRSAAAIIRQDRANFHKFGQIDREDTFDSVFGSVSNRSKLEKMLDNGSTSESARRAIVNGTPLIKINIYRNSVDVLVIE